jgi:glycosyltransferase involved in cell wall biosynthesis
MRPFALLREFRSLKPDLVITHNLAGWGYLPWIIGNFLRIPVIHDNHDMYLVCVKTTRWKPEQGLCVRTCVQCIPRLVATKLFWKGGVMISNSEFLECEIKKRISHKVKTDYEIVYPPTKIAPEFNSPSQIKYDAVFVGRIEESKGIRQFLEASSGKGLFIGVGGVGELREELEAKYPQVSFLGQVNGQNLMAQSRILVVPSLCNETFGRVVLEGIAAGIPVLVSNRGGIVEFKSRKGSQMIVINPENIIDFANKIDLALTMGCNDEPINTEWLEDHYYKQLVKFNSVVARFL